jgi:hypothetical protein
MVLKRYKSVSAHIKCEFVGFMGEQFNAIRMQGTNYVKNPYCVHVQYIHRSLSLTCLETNKYSQHLKK